MWKMEPNEILLNRSAGGGNTNGKTGEGFIDRSKVRILLCDNDTKSSQEVFNLLCKCSYQVTSVRSPRQVIDALNAEGPDIDIILSEVDLPISKGFKMLKYIMRDKDLRRIPVIMMSAQDEVSLVVKCLRLGAADYLVKPLRTNELLNLWTHMWRRRRMLGLSEKNIMNREFDLVPSDPSDANTNSTTLFSDDTDEKPHKNSNPEISVCIPRKDESSVIIAPGHSNAPIIDLSDDQPNVADINEQQGKLMFGPKKSELRIGQSSAFFTYVKSSVLRCDEATPPLFNNLNNEYVVSDSHEHDYVPPQENIHRNTTFPDSMSPEYSQQMSSKISKPPEARTQTQQSGTNEGYNNPYSAYPYYLPGPMNPMMMPSPSSVHQHNMNTPHYPPPPHHHLPGMTSFPYYPVSLCLLGQMPPGMHTWPTYGSSSNNNIKLQKIDHREAALLKFRQKRKERCFDKKIRYVNRKKLAERRPRVRGQFVRKINGINVDLNGQPASTDFDEDDDDDDEEEEDQDQDHDQSGRYSSPENNYAGFDN